MPPKRPSARRRPSEAARAREPWREVILAKLEQQLTSQRIHQDLVSEHGFTGKYHSVRRFVGQLGSGRPLPFRRMECAAGEEAQVDFGTGAPLQFDGKRRRTHVFRIVLSHSRKGYSEAVYRQTTDEFLRCLENAFWSWGGVPRTLVLDNLKAAVEQADWYDPELNPKLRSFAAHYGLAVLPTKPRMPRHKGKTESGIGYVKGNGLKGHVFDSLDAENQHLQKWEATVADLRVHGTIRQQVGKVFAEVERPALLPLPAARFACFHEARRMVHRDGHVEVARAYYSVPPEYLARRVWVRWDGRSGADFQRAAGTDCHARPARAGPIQHAVGPHRGRENQRRGARRRLVVGPNAANRSPRRGAGRRRLSRSAASRGCACCKVCCTWPGDIPATSWKGPVTSRCPTVPIDCGPSAPC